MLLSEVNNEKVVKVVAIDTGNIAKQRLLALGIHPNDILQVVSNPSFGPVLIKNLSKDNARIAIGRGIAQKIKVENVN
ncbi:MAG: ferrous iron transport protein A [Ignavibacteria bacterium]|nr:ferrous iron transport protein A [Ignavibacteria bacterium]